MYVAVQHEGKTWHLFNGARMPLGRIAKLAADYLRGKHKPTYVANKSGADGDYCVIVNAANQHVTGRKRDQKLYRNYTGYVGNMKETTLRHMLQKNPEEVLFKAIKGMVPKNRLRDDLIKKKLFVYPGPFHPHHNKGLPQFTEQDPHDINEVFDFGKLPAA